jgi:Tol biopolymer transport system component
LERSPEDRLESWKEIAAYLRRDVTTVQRWERREGMPVHRHLHDKAGSVYAFRSELDAWAQDRRAAPAPADPRDGFEPADGSAGPPDEAAIASRRRLPMSVPIAIVAVVLAGVFIFWQLRPRDGSSNPLADARFQQLTNLGGNEHAAALSRDGRFAAFLSNREGPTDVWVTQVGTGRFYNLTRDTGAELVNPSVRTLGFSPDGAFVTFWRRTAGGSSQPDIGIWSVPVLGGPPRPYLEGVAEFDWSSDGTRLAYHTAGPGDPMFVRTAGQEARHIFSAPAGLHSHFPIWSPDQRFIYFVQGSVPDRMDIWRIRPTGGSPERITHRESRVSHPVFLNARTLLYLDGDRDGSGPWLHSLDIERREPHRVSVGLERYTSLAASADGRRLVATLAGARRIFWRFPLTGTLVDSTAGQRIELTTGSGTSPRLGPDYLLYVSSSGDRDSIWKLQGDAATELWSAPETRIIGGPAIARDWRRIAFSAQRNGATSLHTVNVDGTNDRIVTRSLQLHGTPAWAPDGQSITVAALVNGTPRLFSVPVEGGQPAPLVQDHSADPMWSSDGELVIYSGPDIGTIYQVKAATRTGNASPVPSLTLSRGSKYVTFMPGRRSLVVLRGEAGHKNLWLVDLETGTERQLTNLPPEFSIRDFDISPDGRGLVVEQVQEHSDIVLIELPAR